MRCPCRPTAANAKAHGGVGEGQEGIPSKMPRRVRSHEPDLRGAFRTTTEGTARTSDADAAAEQAENRNDVPHGRTPLACVRLRIARRLSIFVVYGRRHAGRSDCAATHLRAAARGTTPRRTKRARPVTESSCTASFCCSPRAGTLRRCGGCGSYEVQVRPATATTAARGRMRCFGTHSYRRPSGI